MFIVLFVVAVMSRMEGMPFFIFVAVIMVVVVIVITIIEASLPLVAY